MVERGGVGFYLSEVSVENHPAMAKDRSRHHRSHFLVGPLSKDDGSFQVVRLGVIWDRLGDEGKEERPEGCDAGASGEMKLALHAAAS